MVFEFLTQFCTLYIDWLWFYESSCDFDNHGGYAIELDANVKVRAKFKRESNVVVFKPNEGLII